MGTIVGETRTQYSWPLVTLSSFSSPLTQEGLPIPCHPNTQTQ